MVAAAQLTGKRTNNSVRRTMCTELLRACIPPTTVVRLSGHKNVASINNYATTYHDQQKQLCNILQHQQVTRVDVQPSTSHAMVTVPMQYNYQSVSELSRSTKIPYIQLIVRRSKSTRRNIPCWGDKQQRASTTICEAQKSLRVIRFRGVKCSCWLTIVQMCKHFAFGQGSIFDESIYFYNVKLTYNLCAINIYSFLFHKYWWTWKLTHFENTTVFSIV